MRLCTLLVAFTWLAGCSTAGIPCASPAEGDRVYVTQGGWHVQIGIPVDELTGPLTFLKTVFPHAEVIEFGYGKKTFFTSSEHNIDDYLLGPFPGAAVIQAFGLKVLPTEAYPADDTIILAIPPGGKESLSRFIWDDLAKSEQGKAILSAYGDDPQSLFYKANSTYNILHTCNTWAAEVLRAAEVPLSSDGIVFARQAMNRAAEANRRQCDLR